MDRIPVRHISSAQQEPDYFDSFSIRDVQSLLAGKDMIQEIHRHDFFYILALKKGTGSHEIDFSPNIITNDSVFLMRPGQVHQLLLKAGSTGYLMQFKDHFYFPDDKTSRQQLRRAGNINHYQLDANKFQHLLNILDYMFREYSDKQPGYREIIKANMDIFFIELVRQHTQSASQHLTLYVQERLEELLALLEAHAFQHKQVSEYAGMMSLSAYQLNTITRNTLGKTCSQLINDHILLEAKRILRATSNQINQVADHLGYEDVSYFIRFFKKHTGQSPEAFRNNFT